MFRKIIRSFNNIRMENLFNKPQFVYENINNELNKGEIPYEWKFNKKLYYEKLDNEVKTCTIKSNSDLCTISVFIRAGSKHEDISGIAHFIEHMHFKGTKIRSKDQLNYEIENNGALLNAYTTREFTSYFMNFDKKDVRWAVSLLGDILINSNYDNGLIDLERETIYYELLESNKVRDDALWDYSHMNCYKNQKLGKPVLGLKENIYSIKREDILNFHKKNYVGNNISIVGYGNYDHDSFLNEIKNSFGKLEKNTRLNNQENITFNSSNLILNSKDDDSDLYFNILYESFGWNHPYYFVNQIFLNYLDKYKYDKNYIHEKDRFDLKSLLNNKPDIKEVNPIYIPYENSGLFGLYFNSTYSEFKNCLDFNSYFFNEMLNNIEEEKIMESRSLLFKELMYIENGEELTQEIGTHMMQMNRIITKEEIALRISYLSDKKFLIENIKNMLKKPPSLTIWGDDSKIENKDRILKKYDKITIE